MESRPGIVLAQAGKRVRIYEANEEIGGGARSGSLTLEGFTHDVCSAVHPLAAGSPFFKSLPLARCGLDFIYPPAALGSVPARHHPPAIARDTESVQQLAR